MKQGIDWIQDKIYEVGSKRVQKKEDSHKKVQKQEEIENIDMVQLKETKTVKEEEIT